MMMKMMKMMMMMMVMMRFFAVRPIYKGRVHLENCSVDNDNDNNFIRIGLQNYIVNSDMDFCQRILPHFE